MDKRFQTPDNRFTNELLNKIHVYFGDYWRAGTGALFLPVILKKGTAGGEGLWHSPVSHLKLNLDKCPPPVWTAVSSSPVVVAPPHQTQPRLFPQRPGELPCFLSTSVFSWALGDCLLCIYTSLYKSHFLFSVLGPVKSPWDKEPWENR